MVNQRIMLVDDRLSTKLLVAHALEGMEIVVVGTIQDACVDIFKQKFGLVLVSAYSLTSYDDGNSFSKLTELRLSVPSVPIILIRFDLDICAESEALKCGINDSMFVSRFDSERLKARVDKWIRITASKFKDLSHCLSEKGKRALSKWELLLSPEQVEQLKVTASTLTNAFDSARNGDPIPYDEVVWNTRTMLDSCRNRNVMLALSELSGHDAASFDHSLKVSLYVEGIARVIKIDSDEMPSLLGASILHDIGKALVPLETLNFTGRYSPEQRKIIEQHTLHADKMLRGKVPDGVVDIATKHHERMDGKGYPYGLKGLEIPFYARILAVADVFEALRAKRPYKEIMPIPKVIEILKMPGHLDQGVVNIFVSVWWF